MKTNLSAQQGVDIAMLALQNSFEKEFKDFQVTKPWMTSYGIHLVSDKGEPPATLYCITIATKTFQLYKHELLYLLSNILSGLNQDA